MRKNNIALLRLLGFGVLAVLFQFIEIAVIFCGLTLHYDRLNSVCKFISYYLVEVCIFHIIGTGGYLFYLLDKWHFKIMIYLWVVFT